MLDKFKKLRETQKSKEGDKDKGEEEDAQETLHEVLQDIREEYFSDLNPEEVPNSDVSDDNEDLEN
jgi:5'-3' exoribonuclease 1